MSARPFFPGVANTGAAGKIAARGRLDVDLGEVIAGPAHPQAVRLLVDERRGPGHQSQPSRHLGGQDKPPLGIDRGYERVTKIQWVLSSSALPSTAFFGRHYRRHDAQVLTYQEPVTSRASVI